MAKIKKAQMGTREKGKLSMDTADARKSAIIKPKPKNLDKLNSKAASSSSKDATEKVKKLSKYVSEIAAGRGDYSKPRTEAQQKKWEKEENKMINYKGRPPMKGGGKIKKAKRGGATRIVYKDKRKYYNSPQTTGAATSPAASPISRFSLLPADQSFLPSAEYRMSRKGSKIVKKAKSGSSLGMKSVKAGFDKNPSVTRADIIVAGKGQAKKGTKVKAKGGAKMGKCKYGCK